MAGVLESRKGRGVMKKGPAETAWGRAFIRGDIKAEAGALSPSGPAWATWWPSAGARVDHPLSAETPAQGAPRRDEDRPQREPRCSSPGGLGARCHLDRPWGDARRPRLPRGHRVTGHELADPEKEKKGSASSFSLRHLGQMPPQQESQLDVGPEPRQRTGSPLGHQQGGPH